MDYAVLKKIAEYSDVYEVAALGISSVEEMKAALKKTTPLSTFSMTRLRSGFPAQTANSVLSQDRAMFLSAISGAYRISLPK